MDSAHTLVDSLTPSQRRAVNARGNVLVMAGAGTGKTKTLVERCLDCLERDGAAIDELLIVTFTEAAAAEMRDRLRRAIEARALAEATAPATESGRREDRWAEQLARFDLAHIGTLHSFCLKLIREHFYDLGLDPRLAVLDEGAARQLANETIEEQFTAQYTGTDEFSLAAQNLIQVQGGGRDDSLRQLVLQLHNYSQARPDAAGWLAAQRGKFSAAQPVDWEAWLPLAIEGWRQEWLPVLKNLAAPIADPAHAIGVSSPNEKAAELVAVLARLGGPGATPAGATGRKITADLLAEIVSADEHWPTGRKTVLRKPMEDLFEEAEFLHSLAVQPEGSDPLAEDWGWVRGHMETLLRLAEEFAANLAQRKRADGLLDFHDLEQFALKLLWDFATGQPTVVAANWRAKLKFVFVDEYQDINAAQDKIIQGLSREEVREENIQHSTFNIQHPTDGPNRFLVGDVKQSIYRFRLADPQIFREYARNWHGAAGEIIPLSENFRSRAPLLQLVNSIFRLVMHKEVGGVEYDADAELRPGPRPAQDESPPAQATAPRGDLLLRYKISRSESRDGESSDLAGLDDTQREARLVAHHLRALVAGGHEIFDDQKKISRALEWRDVAILMRSPRGRSEVFAKEFERAGIPLAVARGGFYESAEILDLLSLLQLLDNPLQDVPCIAVLRSPFVGLSLDELAEIRLAAREKHFWTALNRGAEPGFENAGLAAKISRFLERFSRWRKLAKLVSLSQCLDEVLAETSYADWLRAQPRGAQRAANVAGFLQLAQQFDEFQRQGLFRFLRFIEAQQETEAVPEVSAIFTENAVRLMSIHQSKGLEFPVVVLADLAKQFNERDLHGDIIFDEEFGLCPKVKPPHTGGRYPSLPHWLAQRRQKRELRGEELRLLYVALTRARENVILTASVTEKAWLERWTKPQPVTARKIASAKSFADWLALWFSNELQSPHSKIRGLSEGTFEVLRWRMVPDTELENTITDAGPAIDPTPTIGNPPSFHFGAASRQSAIGNDTVLDQLRSRLEWRYPFEAATQRKAKSSVTALRREAQELDEEAERIFPEGEPVLRLKSAGGRWRLTAPEIGAAHHKFLQHVALDKTGDLAAEADRLTQENYLSADERAGLDLDALETFWTSSLGRSIQAHPEAVRRELPFTARFSPGEIAGITGAPVPSGLEDEFVIVQGVADLVLLLPREIWLVDFKTDEIRAREVSEKIRIYRPQLQLYAAALEKIFARKVTLRALHFLAAGRTEEIYGLF